MTAARPLAVVPPGPTAAEDATNPDLYAEDFERRILGCRVKYGKRADLPASAFRNPSNELLWELMDEIDAELRTGGLDATVDYNMVIERVHRSPKIERYGGLRYVALALGDDCIPSALPYYAARVRDLARARDARNACAQAARDLPHVKNEDELVAALELVLADVARAAGRDLAVRAFRRAFPRGEGE
jgi:hypothetical protein